MRHLFAATALGLLAAGSTSCAGKSPAAQAVAPGQQLLDAVAASSRTSANVLRDRYRHPVETLSFFGVQPDHVVVEIWPAGGWYTEILAPYLKRGGGTYYGVGSERMVGGPKRLMSESPELYDQIRTADFPAAAGSNRVPDNSADVVLTFRNVHNWMMGENPSHFDGVKSLWAETFPDDPPWNRAEVAVPAKLAIQPDLMLVADDNGEVVGTAMAGYDGHRGWLYAVAVRQSHRRMGIGSKLVEEAERRLKTLGCVKINLQVRPSNSAVANFYRRIGYAAEERISMGKRV